MSADLPSRVCLVTTIYPRQPGDYRGIFIQRLAKLLAQAGLNICVVAPGAPGAPTYELLEGVGVYRFNYWWPPSRQKVAYGAGIPNNLSQSWLAKLQFIPFLFAWLFKIYRVCRKERCELIHAQFLPSALFSWSTARWLGIPLVLTVRGDDIRSRNRFLLRNFCKLVDEIITISPELTIILQDAQVDECKITFIPNALDERLDPERVDGGKIQAEFELGDQAVVTFVARLDEFKDPETYLDSIPIVLQSRRDVRFLITGDGPLMDDLKSKAAGMEVDGCLAFTGPRADVPEILAASTLFTALSPVENIWSNTLVEALAMGVPCIVTNAGLTPSYLVHNESAYLIPPGDPLALADAILALLQDEERRQALRIGGWKTLAENHFRRENSLQKTLEIYRKARN